MHACTRPTAAARPARGRRRGFVQLYAYAGILGALLISQNSSCQCLRISVSNCM